MNTPEETLDMMRDEFARIAANNDATEEIKSLCRRAMMDITVRVPLITQRDDAEREARHWKRLYLYTEQASLAGTLAQMSAWASALQSEPATEVINSIHRAGIALASQLSTENEQKKQTETKTP